MTDTQERPAGWQGKFTPQYPELGTGPVNYEDSISPEFFEAEREAVFKRSWLYVGREEKLPKPGTFFTRELPGGLASIVLSRGLDGTVYAFHNVCAHRGNKVVWQEHPGEESSGSCRQFTCKYHGWRYGLDGCVSHVTNEEQFFDLDKDTLRMPEVPCDVFAGFIFVNLSEDPVPLRTFLGDRILELEAYPFGEMTERYGFSTLIKGNWKLAVDSVCEWYHPAYVHAAFISTNVAEAEKMVPPVDAYHYDVFRPHMLTSVPGPPPLKPREPGTAGEPKREQRWVYKLFRAGLFGPDDIPDIGERPEFLNKGRIPSWGNDQFWLFPNLSIQIWARNYYITYTYWPESVGTHTYEIDLYFVPPDNAHERLAQELVVDSTIEFAMQ
ncbi:MAG: aromatic ring-hydroxylating dioxygenase subunit alpha, partial [Acidimicrobiales bacterium]